MFLRLVAFSVLFLPFVAHADNLKVLLGNDMARVQYASESIGKDLGRIEVEGGYLYSTKDANNSDYLLHLGLQVRGESLEAPVIVTVGSRLYFGNARDNTVGGIGIGGDVTFAPDSWKGFSLGAFVYFVPEVVAFSKAKGLTEYGVMANFQVSSQAVVMLGIQNISVEIENQSDRTIDDGIFIGVDLKF